MKALIFILSFVLFGSSVFATEKKTSDTFDVQSKPIQHPGQEFQATYNSKHFLAWTAQEEKFLSPSTLDKLAVGRAADICQYFGFAKTNVRPTTERMVKALGETHYIVNYIQDGKLTVINAGEGFMSNVVIPTVFKKISCYL